MTEKSVSHCVWLCVAGGDSASCRNSKRGFGAPWPQFRRFFFPIHFPLLMQRAGDWKKKERRMGLLACFHVQVQLRLSSYKRVTYPSLRVCWLQLRRLVERMRRKQQGQRKKKWTEQNESQLLKQNKKEKTKITKRENGNSLQHPSGFPNTLGIISRRSHM